MANSVQAINLKRWISEHKDLLKPPIGAEVLWNDSEFMVMAIGGPNARRDFHVDPSDEFFYQLKGDIVLEFIDGTGKRRRETICEGDVLLLPANVPHSPQRPADSIGLVIERVRSPGEPESYAWYCEQCDAKLYELVRKDQDLLQELKMVSAEFNRREDLRTCKACGCIQPVPEGPRL